MRVDLCLGNGPLGKAVASKERPLAALTAEGSVCVRGTHGGGFLQEGVHPGRLVALRVWREVWLSCGWMKLPSPAEGDRIARALS